MSVRAIAKARKPSNSGRGTSGVCSAARSSRESGCRPARTRRPTLALDQVDLARHVRQLDRAPRLLGRAEDVQAPAALVRRVGGVDEDADARAVDEPGRAEVDEDLAGARLEEGVELCTDTGRG